MGTIFDIKRYAIHDGPNIRTTVFLKGCPLRCVWCHNPEGMDASIQLLWNAASCLGCGACIEACPHDALSLENRTLTRDETQCQVCQTCVSTCPALCHESTGREATVDEVLIEIQKDIPFFDQSGGGVTFSGGEPLMQPQFLLDLLQACGRLGLHRAVDTSAHAPTHRVQEIAAHTELFLVDIKHMDPSIHRHYTGVDNALILRNIEMLSKEGAAIIIRIPLIDGFNTDETHLKRSAQFLASLHGIQRVDLLPLHTIARGKYKKLGKHVEPTILKPPSAETCDRSVSVFENMGLRVTLGG